jgi:hypothetical protein
MFQKESNEFFSGQESVKRVCCSLKTPGKTLLEVSGGGENEEEETSVRKVGKGVREESGKGDGEEERG